MACDLFNMILMMKKNKYFIGVFLAACLSLVVIPKGVCAKHKKSVPDSLQTLCYDVNGVSFTMQRVEGGVFFMGGTREQHKESVSIDKPVHTVALDAYYIATTEVTQALWKAVMPEWEFVESLYLPEFPVCYVSWDDCQEFIRRLCLITNMPFRLPTEAEWEFAARGGNKSSGYRFAGGNEIDSVSWSLSNSNFRRHEVAQKKPNELGLFDMTGNVSEWCSDWYASYHLGTEPNPKGPQEGTLKIVRGSSFDDCVENSYLSRRGSHNPQSATNYCGLRLALTLPHEPTLQVREEMEITQRVKIGNVRLKMHYVPHEHFYYISENAITWRVWSRIMKEEMQGKWSHAVIGKTPKEWASFLEMCRQKSMIPFDLATEEEVQYALTEKIIPEPKITQPRQRRWEKDVHSIQRHRRFIKKLQPWVELVSSKIQLEVPDDPILLTYNDSEKDDQPKWLVIRGTVHNR